MLFERHCEKDVNIIKKQLGCKDVYIGGIIERCKYGFPRIILLNPIRENQKSKELNYAAVSNLMWLTCPYLNNRIHELETSGLIGRLTDFIQHDTTLNLLMRKAHANFYFLRNAVCTMFAGSSYEGERIGVFKRGVGGIRDIRTLKCLHLHFCHYSVFKENIAGLMTHRLLEGKVNCDNILCEKNN